jgi:hypothetical protein
VSPIARQIRGLGATLLPQVQPSPAWCATCRGIAELRRVLSLIRRRSCRSSCARRPCAGTSGNIAFVSPLTFLLLESVPIASVPIQGVTPPNCICRHSRGKTTARSLLAITSWENSSRGSAYARTILTSVDLMRATAISPSLRFSSRTTFAVLISNPPRAD